METPIYFSQHTIQRFKEVQALLDQLDPASAPQAVIVPRSPQPESTIIVFPGSFNPPTNAHLALLEQAHQFAHSPLFSSYKDEQDPLLYAAMSKLTTDKENVERPLLLDRVILLDTVLQQHLPGTGIMLFNRGLYVEQAEAVRSSFPGVRRLFFLLGYDKIVQILDPHYYEDRTTALNTLFSLAELLVAPRGTANAVSLSDLLSQPHNQPFVQYIHELPLSSTYRDISSSRVRQHGAQHLQDIPSEVQRFMSETRAYDTPLRLKDGAEIDYYEERAKRLQVLLQNL